MEACEEIDAAIEKDDPFIVIGSPPCTMMSQLQELNWAKHSDKPEWRCTFLKLVEEAKAHIRFCCKIYKARSDRGRYWLHEHPWQAKSWKMKNCSN